MTQSNTRSTNFEKVGDFQREILGNQYPEHSGMPPDPMLELRCIQEELYELAAAIQQKDLVEAADAVVDTLYFAYGLAFKMGLPIDEMFEIVHQANMTKIPAATLRRADDAVKPKGWVDPRVLLRMMVR